MAQATVTKKVPDYVGKLEAEIQKAFPGSRIWHESVRKDRYRVLVVSKKFERLGHPERQRVVWNIADSALDKSDLLKVSMILTMSESEYPGE